MRILTRLRSLFHRLAGRFRRHRPATAPVITLCSTGRPIGGGPREVARRRRQIERGMLKCSPTT